MEENGESGVQQADLDQLIEIINNLDETQADLIELRFFQELSFKEIADKTNCSINTALGRMRYALMNLRKIIDKHQIILTN